MSLSGTQLKNMPDIVENWRNLSTRRAMLGLGTSKTLQMRSCTYRTPCWCN